MDKYCAGCFWFDEDTNVCHSDKTLVFLTGPSDSCPEWEDFEAVMNRGDQDG